MRGDAAERDSDAQGACAWRDRTAGRSRCSTTSCRRRRRARSSLPPTCWRSAGARRRACRRSGRVTTSLPLALDLAGLRQAHLVDPARRGRRRAGETPPLLMHPDDARARGLDGAQLVRVCNELGAVVLPLRVTDAVARGVVASEKGAWLATSPTGQTISALVSADARADLARGRLLQRHRRRSGGGVARRQLRSWPDLIRPIFTTFTTEEFSRSGMGLPGSSPAMTTYRRRIRHARAGDMDSSARSARSRNSAARSVNEATTQCSVALPAR